MRLNRILSFAIATMLVAAAPGEPAAYGQASLAGKVDFTTNVKSGSRAPNREAVVWLTPLDRQSASQIAQPKAVQLVQKDKTFHPHLLVIPAGSTVVFPNRDPFFHNVFSLFEGKRFDLGLYEAGGSRAVVFDREGISYIFCNIHAEMSAVIIALKTPYYGISDRKGMITIADVPPGRYEMHVWDERALPEPLAALTR